MNNKLKLFGICLLFCSSTYANPNLFRLLDEGEFEDLQRELALNPERIKETATLERNLLHVLAQREDGNTDAVVGIARWLVAVGADVNALDAFERTPHAVALEAGNWRLATILQQEIAPSIHYDVDMTQNPFAAAGGFGGGDNPDNFGRFGFLGDSGIDEMIPHSLFDRSEQSDEPPLKRQRLSEQSNFAALVTEAIAALDSMNSDSAENSLAPVLHGSPSNYDNEKEHKEEQDDAGDEDDDDFVVSQAGRANEAYGRAYKRAKHASRNPKPPPTGFQKRKADLTYKEGPKSSLAPPSGSKQDRRASKRKH